MPNLPTTPSLYALLIGIDCYLPNRLPDGSSYRNLTGCVRDILHVEAFLHRKLGMESANILKLTASNSVTAQPAEPEEFWPTYDNIVGAFAKLAEMGKPGDQIYIHYSGHGGRCAALIPELKTNGLDEVLVPMDLGVSEARYVRDIEIAKLLQTLVDKQLLVTLVLDSCHSAGATRAADTQNARSNGSIDTRPPVKTSLVAPLAELASNWKRLQAATTRNLSANSGWSPGTRDYVLLAACRASESAYEYAFDGQETNGALTYWLLNTMEEMGLGLTYNQLNDRIVAKVHSQFETQTPQLEGDGTRVVFGSEQLQPTYAAMVMQVDQVNHRVLLNAGQAHGIRKGAQFAIYSQLERDVTAVNARLGIAIVEQLGATDSWSAVTHLSNQPIEQGAQAVLINPGAVKLLRKVKITEQGRHAAALSQVIGESAWLESAASNEAADYEVAIETGSYQIKDRVGIPLSNQTPEITMDEPNGVARLIQRLEHITRYQAIQELDNYDPTSPLAGKLQVDWAGYQRDYEPGDKMEPVPFATRGDTPAVTVGGYAFLRVKNLSTTVLNVMILNLQPDWGIAQVHPTPPSWFASFDPGQEQLIPFDVNLPGGYSQGRDVMKVFATIGTANFRWLQLPPLDQETTSVRRNGGPPLNPLDRLLATISSERPPSRNLVPAAHPSAEWTTAQVAIEVHRS